MKKTVEFIPLGDRVLLQRDDAVTQSKGGIIIPEGAKEKPKTGKIIAAGESITSKVLSVGHRVMFTSFAGTEINIEGESFLVLKQEEILGVIK